MVRWSFAKRDSRRSRAMGISSLERRSKSRSTEKRSRRLRMAAHVPPLKRSIPVSVLSSAIPERRRSIQARWTVSRVCGISIAVVGEGIADFLLKCANSLPVNRVIEVVPRIEIQHIRNRALCCCPKDTAASLYSLLIMEKPRVQAATDNAMSQNLKSPGDTGNEREGIQRLQNVSLVPQHGLGCEVGELMQTRAPEEHRIDILRRDEAIETTLDAMEHACLCQAVGGHTP